MPKIGKLWFDLGQVLLFFDLSGQTDKKNGGKTSVFQSRIATFSRA